MKKLMLGLMMAFAVTAEAEVKTYVQIGNLKYDLDTEAKTATICGYDDFDTPLTKIDVGEVEWMGQKYTVTAIGEGGASKLQVADFCFIAERHGDWGARV